MDLAQMPRAAGLVRGADPGTRWHPGAQAEVLSELLCQGEDGGGTGVALALLGQALGQREALRCERRPLLWVQDAASIRLAGRPYRPGLPGRLRDRIIHVTAKTAADALFALEEGARCRDLCAVLGEIAGNPRSLDFTASRRLALAAERHDALLLLLRHDARADLSAARLRWRAGSGPSALHPWDKAAPGQPRWRVELFRARAHPPGAWLLEEAETGLTATPVPEGQASALAPASASARAPSRSGEARAHG